MEATDEALDIQAQVLQTTLQEITATRRASAANEKDGEGVNDDDDEVAEADDCCVICLDSISEPCTAMPCAHSHFDFVCLVSWLQEHPNCPLCKAAIYKVRYVDSTSNESFYRVPNAPRPRNTNGDNGNGDQSGNPALSNLLRQRRNDQRRRRDCDANTHSTPTPGEAIERRRHIYRHQLYSLHVGSNRISGYKPTPTPDQFATTPHLITRARLWIRRELQVFAFLSDPEPTAGPSGSTSNASERELTRRRNNAEFLLEYIIAILKTVDIQGSAGQAEDMLADFLGRDHARLFLHELRSWLRSPAHSLVAWDKEVKYPQASSTGEASRKRKAQNSLDVDDEGEDDIRRHASGSERSQTPRWPERDTHHRQTGHERIWRRRDFGRSPRWDGNSESNRQGSG
ncbi:uncharacterized protein B0T23DRAFT_325240 [Neurospora hispaniola]|uniref:RING-type E3 ubiquitin transferase n=1 Tax=Neurospora hispaniola TaxID=588809 RepID=A0AAJ0I0V5_9PEZI|nr:hypothetical protein B0T23DRAFT_325240 [Neurospora hispaniola]